MVAWWLLSTADAAEILFMLATPVQVQVDGVHIETLTSSNAQAKNLAPGTHTVRILDMLSKPILTQEVVLAADDQVVLRYKSRALTETSRGKLELDGSPSGGSPVTSAPAGARSAMDSADFSLLLQHVKAGSSDQAKLDLIKFAGALNSFSVDQTASLMGAFSTDPHKIEVVKIAQPKLTDPERAFVLSAQVTEPSRPAVQALFSK
jgi:hypothetical protein